MREPQPQRSGQQSATTGYSQHPQYTDTVDLNSISASEYNQIKIELQLIKIDFDRIFTGYKQIGIAFAEVLLDHPQAWRNYLLNNVYVSTLHPDVRQDVATFLETVELHSRLRGATDTRGAT